MVRDEEGEGQPTRKGHLSPECTGVAVGTGPGGSIVTRVSGKGRLSCRVEDKLLARVVGGDRCCHPGGGWRWLRAGWWVETGKGQIKSYLEGQKLRALRGIK